MYSLSSFTAAQLAHAYDFGAVRRPLDVGGGGGAYTIELCRNYPHLNAVVYDLPLVCELTEARIADAGLSDRIKTWPGNFHTDAALPPGYDAILLSNVLHDWSEAQNREILHKCHAALADGGTIIIADFVLDDDEAGPPAAALMALAMLVETEGGRTYSGAQFTQWLRDAGCVEVQSIPLPDIGVNGVICGRKTGPVDHLRR